MISATCCVFWLIDTSSQASRCWGNQPKAPLSSNGVELRLVEFSLLRFFISAAPGPLWWPAASAGCLCPTACPHVTWPSLFMWPLSRARGFQSRELWRKGKPAPQRVVVLLLYQCQVADMPKEGPLIFLVRRAWLTDNE